MRGQRRLAGFICAAIVVVAVAACGAVAPPEPSVAPSAPATPDTTPATVTPSVAPSASTSVFPASPIVGIVTSVDAESLSKVTGFTLRATDGKSYEFLIGNLVNGNEFPPGHLAEHQAAGSPVKVTFHVEGSQLVATRLDDAG